MGQYNRILEESRLPEPETGGIWKDRMAIGEHKARHGQIPVPRIMIADSCRSRLVKHFMVLAPFVDIHSGQTYNNPATRKKLDSRVSII
jgi:hypothetical protein